MSFMNIKNNTLAADHDHSRFQFILLAEQITLSGNKMSV